MSFGKCYYLNGGASTYQVLSGSEYNKQHSIGGHAAGVLGFKKSVGEADESI